MKKVWKYLAFILIITIIVPTILVKTFNFVSKEEKTEKNKIDIGKKEDKVTEEYEFNGYIKIYDIKSQEVKTIELEEYVKGVVAAEMPAEFHIEALKAQAVASRTYALNRMKKFKDGHPDHMNAPLCTGIHCQAYLSLKELEEVHSEKWVDKYWSKIEEAVNRTKGKVMYYEGQLIEPLYHSTSGGMTEDSEDVFSTNIPYLRSVSSPYEEGAPKLKNVVDLTVDEFISKIKGKYPGVKLTKEDIPNKVKLVEKTESGRIKKIMIDGQVVSGTEIRELFDLNSTNFKIVLNPSKNIMQIETIGYGHGVGMSQWGANGMAKKGKNYLDILKHYYTGVDIGKYNK